MAGHVVEGCCGCVCMKEFGPWLDPGAAAAAVCGAGLVGDSVVVVDVVVIACVATTSVVVGAAMVGFEIWLFPRSAAKSQFPFPG